MRITGGSARGRRLKSPPPGVRPTSDTVREAIYNVLDAREADYERVLDLYAGSGALGIEALSRGGGHGDFVDATHAALILENLGLAGLAGHGTVHQIAVERAGERLQGPYSLVLADPPYDDDAALGALELLLRPPLVDGGTMLVLEHSRRREPPEAFGALRLAWNRRYGDTQVSIYRAPAEEEPP